MRYEHRLRVGRYQSDTCKLAACCVVLWTIAVSSTASANRNERSDVAVCVFRGFKKTGKHGWLLLGTSLRNRVFRISLCGESSK